MVFGKKKADAARGTAKTLAPIPGKAFGVSGKQKKATGAALPDKASVSETDSQDGKKKNRLLLILAAMGPGIVTAMAGNDAGGISTYSTAGAKFGFTTLWVIPIMCVLLIVVEMTAARMGAVTGKGFAALIRERFGIRIAAFAMLAHAYFHFVVAELGYRLAGLRVGAAAHRNGEGSDSPVKLFRNRKDFVEPHARLRRRPRNFYKRNATRKPPALRLGRVEPRGDVVGYENRLHVYFFARRHFKRHIRAHYVSRVV